MEESPFTKVPNSIFDIEGLTVYERLILLFIVRKTIGFNKKSDGISLSQFTKGTGISKNTVLKSLESLKRFKFIKIQKQTRINGGKSYNRYTPLVQEMDYLVQEMNKGGSPGELGLVHEVNIQKKIIQKKIDNREKERIGMNIYYDLSDNEKLRETDKYISHLIEEEDYIKNEKSFKLKIKRQLSNEDEFQLEDFEKWYLEKTCKELSIKYVGKFFNRDKISQIYPYFNTDSYDPNNKFIIWFNRDDEKSSFTECFDNRFELEDLLNEVTDENETI